MPINQPSAIELLEAVSEFLQAEISPTVTDAGVGYRLKVALNALSIVARQLALGDDLVNSEQQRISALLDVKGDADVVSLNHQLIEKIRAGDITASAPELLPSLREISLNKLAIDNPKYSSYKKYRPD